MITPIQKTENVHAPIRCQPCPDRELHQAADRETQGSGDQHPRHGTVLPTASEDRDGYTGKRRSKYVTRQTIRSIHKLLHSCFEQTVKWELIEKNPTEYASRPKADYNKRDIWTVETLFHALKVCEDETLKLAMNLAFSCSMRLGAVLGPTWDCVDISEDSIAAGISVSEPEVLYERK